MRPPPLDPNRIEPYEIVRIATGERWTPAYMQNYQGGHVAYSSSDLKKDGTPNQGVARHWLATPASSRALFVNYARYDATREAVAQPIRDEITLLERELAMLREALTNLYRPAPPETNA